MKVDFNKTLELVKGGLLQPTETWHSYLGENPGWQQTLLVLTGPMILANVVLSLLLSRMMGTMAPYGIGGNWFAALVLGLVFACISFAIAVAVFNFLAGVFEGQPDFSRAFAAMSLVAIPAWIAGIIGAAVPWVGGLISLAGGIVSLVFLYKIVPLAWQVPEGKRVLHFVVSLVAVIVVSLVVGSAIGMGDRTTHVPGERIGDRATTGTSGMFGEIGRQADLVASANEDRYEPPGNGKVTRQQAEWVADIMRKTRLTYEEETARLERLGEEMEEAEGRSASAADVARMFQGMGSVISLNTIEMETVKAGGGNWAEYQWVKQQLRNARLQRGEGSEALAHNYARYQDIADTVQGQL